MKMLLLAIVLVLVASTYGTHTHKGMNSLERAKHIREVTSNQNHGKRLLQIGGSILDKENENGRSLSVRSRSGRSMRESFYNQIVARSCGASACCSKKGGICMTNDQPCPGEVTDDCMGDSCICCIPKCECPNNCQSSRCCTRKGGTCISTDKTCNGKLRSRLCLGASCTCCIPDK